METTPEESIENVVEFEDIQLSDTDDKKDVPDPEVASVSIDYNNRLVSKIATFDSTSSDNCDTRFFASKQFYPYTKDLSDKIESTSSEEFELSDDDKSSIAENVNLPNIDLAGMACVSKRHQIESSSSFDHSSTTFKEECYTDAEYISDDESDSKKNQMVNGSLMEGGQDRKLSFGLSVSNLASTVKDVFSSKQTTLSDLNVMNPFSSSVEVRMALPTKLDESKAPLMTCLEFLKSEPVEDELTDVEDFTPELCDNKSPSTTHDLEDVFRYRGKNNFKMPKNVNKRGSWTMETLSDDEISNSEVTQNSHRQRHLKRNSIVTDNDIHSLTDEELIDLDGPGDAAFDSDDLLSRSTTTTTTRIVTTVTTGDNDDGDHEESGTEDLRHSVEVILNQFMSDGDSSKQEDSHLGSEE